METAAKINSRLLIFLMKFCWAVYMYDTITSAEWFIHKLICLTKIRINAYLFSVNFVYLNNFEKCMAHV